MTDRRLQLHSLLQEIIGADKKVYFQPPPNVQMTYPCIVYNRDAGYTKFAGNSPYRLMRRYQVTYIDRDPDSEILDKLALLPLCTYNRFFAANELNHDVFTIYF